MPLLKVLGSWWRPRQIPAPGCWAGAAMGAAPAGTAGAPPPPAAPVLPFTGFPFRTLGTRGCRFGLRPMIWLCKDLVARCAQWAFQMLQSHCRMDDGEKGKRSQTDSPACFNLPSHLPGHLGKGLLSTVGFHVPASSNLRRARISLRKVCKK